MDEDIRVVHIEDKDDGSAIVTLDLSQDMLIALAKIGFLKALKDALETTHD